MKVAVLGLGSWGTAMAVHLSGLGHQVQGWVRGADRVATLQADRENKKYLPGSEFPAGLEVVSELESVVVWAEWVVFAVPSHAIRTLSAPLAPSIGSKPVVNLAKGLEEGSLERILQVLEETLPKAPAASLVGPSHAEEVLLRHPTAVVATSKSEDTARGTQDLFTGESFRVYTNPDVVGVELAVALKNVIALAAGISAGLGYGDNTLGGLITRGLAEMTRLGAVLRAKPDTFFGLAGVGDLVTTCASRHSRNRRVGEALGHGRSLEEALESLGMVAEGVRTTRAAYVLGRREGVEMPIVDQVHEVLFSKKDPREAIAELMSRTPKAEGSWEGL